MAPGFLLDLVAESSSALKAALSGLRDEAADLGVPAPLADTVAKIVRKLVRRAEANLRHRQ